MATKVWEDKMEKSLESFKQQLSSLKTGRANASILDGVKADYYGNPTPLTEMATVSVPDAKTILITPWEASLIPAISAAIVNASIGLAPQADEKSVRLKVPDLTEDTRKDLVKSAQKKAEEAKVSIRMIRRDALDQIKKEQKDKTATEDDVKSFEKDIQKVTDNYTKKIEEVLATKESELSKV